MKSTPWIRIGEKTKVCTKDKEYIGELIWVDLDEQIIVLKIEGIRVTIPMYEIEDMNYA